MSEARTPRLVPACLDEAQSALYKKIVHGPRAQGRQFFPLLDDEGALRGPFGLFLLSPRLGADLQEVGAGIRYRSALPARVRELGILAVAAAMNSDFEWESHAPIAASLGVDDLATLRDGGEPSGLTETEYVALRVARSALAGDVDDELWALAEEALGEAAVFDVVALTGYYRLLAVALRVFRVDPDAPAPKP